MQRKVQSMNDENSVLPALRMDYDSGRPKRILAVDDSPPNVLLLQKTLGNAGYEVIPAYGGIEAIKIAGQALEDGSPLDLVLLDVMMPDMDGFEVCRRLKALAKTRETFLPIVLLTALDKTADKVMGFESGADDYLVKPPAKDELLARVRSMVQMKALQEGLITANRKLEEAQAALERELCIVGEIQRSFLPKVFPSHPKLVLAASYVPSTQAGGDYYDVIEIDKEHWGLVMADVTGHGASAAVVMAVTHLLMRSFVNTFKFPSTALKVVNEKLNAHLSSDHFVTMFYGILKLSPNKKSGGMTFTFSSAGHNPMYLLRGTTGEVIELKTELGFPLRSFMSDEYDEAQIDVIAGDKLVLFTDGLVESANGKGQIIGESRIVDALAEMTEYNAEDTVAGLHRVLEDFCGDEPLRDDLTMFVVHRTS